ncbi:hypothetical protein N1Z87_006809 [Pseudomonas aeruginosa]|nr:hypothetical protein [Pseudomonas aeruginosa]
MKKQTIATLAISILFSVNAFAEYTMKVPVESNSINFISNSNNSNEGESGQPVAGLDSSCVISSTDLAPLGAALLDKWSEPENGFKCVVSIAVDKNLYDGACPGFTNERNIQLWDVMRSRGVDGVSSIRYDGEC